MKVDLLDSKLKKVDSVELNESIWKVSMNPDLVAQCVNIYMSNARTGNAHVKTRGDVSGGGRKPWKQKGTGRARSGSSRSPVWVGGGATFVPNERNWTKRLNKKMKKSALSMMLSERVGSEILNIVKDLYEVERDAVSDIKSVLLVSDNPEVVLKFRNVPSVTIIDSMTLNALDLVKSRKIFFDAESVTKLEARLLNE